LSALYYFSIKCRQLDDDKAPILAIFDREGLGGDEGVELDTVEVFGDVVLSGGFTVEEWLTALIAEIRKHAGPQAELRAEYYCYDTIPREVYDSAGSLDEEP
jgi:hypothetical protein